MSPPPAASGGGRKPLGRLVDALRRRLRPDRAVPPATVPGLGSGEETALSAAARPDAAEREPEPEPEPESPGATLAADAERAPTADEPAVDAAPGPPDADARFDEARDRLRSTIKPPDDTD